MTAGRPIKRRAFVGLAAGSLLLLSGCSIRRVAEDAPAADPNAFPITIDHAYGSTTIPRIPERIVTVGRASAETCMAYGVVPVGVGVGEDGLSSWFTDAQVKAKVLEPVVFSDFEIEKSSDVIKDLNPDVILAVNSQLTRAEYEKLQEIAPVVAFPGHPGNTDWRTTTKTVGRAIGRSEDGDRVVSEVENAIREASDGLIDFAGSSALYFSASATPGAGFTVWGSDTNPMRILRDFGVNDAPALQNIASSAREELAWGQPVYQHYVLPAERASDLQADVPVVAIRADEAEQIESNRVLAGIPGSADQRIVIVQRKKDATALEEASPLSISWVAKNMISEIARVRYSEKKQS